VLPCPVRPRAPCGQHDAPAAQRRISSTATASASAP
jgi:hypothetical protein